MRTRGPAAGDQQARPSSGLPACPGGLLGGGPAQRRNADIERALAGYDHPLLRRLAFVDSYEGGSVPTGQRSFTFRATIADAARTLTDEDVQDFRASFIAFLEQQQLVLRT